MAERSWPDDWNDRMAGRGCPLCAALGQGDNEAYAKVSLKKYKPMTARNEDKNVPNGLL